MPAVHEFYTREEQKLSASQRHAERIGSFVGRPAFLLVILLFEQKTAKVIDLLEELRRDLPNVANRHDSGAAVMQQAMSPEGVLAALDEEVTLPDGSTSAATSAPPATGAAPAAGT